jgi:hypothetical protein
LAGQPSSKNTNKKADLRLFSLIKRSRAIEKGTLYPNGNAQANAPAPPWEIGLPPASFVNNHAFPI